MHDSRSTGPIVHPVNIILVLPRPVNSRVCPGVFLFWGDQIILAYDNWPKRRLRHWSKTTTKTMTSP